MNRLSNKAQKPYLCTRCGRRLIRKAGPAGFFWGCSSYPRCKKTFSDDGGTPYIRFMVILVCPQCETGTLIKYKKNKKRVWVCNESFCQAAFPDLKGKPNRGFVA